MLEKWQVSWSDGFRQKTVDFNKERNGLVILAVLKKSRVSEAGHDCGPEGGVVPQDLLQTLQLLLGII